MKRYVWLALAPIALLAACGPSADSGQVTETVRMNEQTHHEAIAAKDINGVMRLYADDAVVFVPETSPITGGEAIRAYFQQMLADPNLSIERTAGQSWTSSSGDLAVTTYSAEFTHTDPGSGERQAVPMNNQTVWAKAPGADWQIVSDHNVVLPSDDAVAAAGAQ